MEVTTMSEPVTRPTIYVNSDLHRALRIKAAHTQHTVSDLVKDAVRLPLCEDREDLAALVERQKDVSRFLKCFDVYAEDPRGRRCEKMSGQDRYRVRRGSHLII